MLKLMYITNSPEVTRIADNAGVDRIFVDMEYIGKALRQGGMDTVQSHHTFRDISAVKHAVCHSKVMVRVNPIHDAFSDYSSSQDEIDGAIDAGADILMLPYFKSVSEVEQFVCMVNGRVMTLPLIETPEAAASIDDILQIDGIDELYIGLNDLSLGYGKRFMFELLTDGTVETLAAKIRAKGIPFGFGGIAALGQGMLPAEYVIREHYRLGSSCAILSRSFCNTSKISDLSQIQDIFETGVRAIRNLENECVLNSGNDSYFAQNRAEVEHKVALICGQ